MVTTRDVVLKLIQRLDSELKSNHIYLQYVMLCATLGTLLVTGDDLIFNFEV